MKYEMKTSLIDGMHEEKKRNEQIKKCVKLATSTQDGEGGVGKEVGGAKGARRIEA